MPMDVSSPESSVDLPEEDAVAPTSPAAPPEPTSASAKFKFRFGQLQKNVLWEEGEAPLDKARPEALRSIAAECCSNDGGKWCAEYKYVAACSALEGTWEFAAGISNPGAEGARKHCDWPAVRDLGHGGKALAWFADLPAAKKSKLTLPEVAMLRLYTGPMFRPLNAALRGVGKPGGLDELRKWWTCVAVLTCAVFKLSFANSSDTVDSSVTGFSGDSGHSKLATSAPHAGAADDAAARRATPHFSARPVLETVSQHTSRRSSAGGPREVFRGLPVSSLTDCDSTSGAVSADMGLDFEREGGVELAFCSTTTDRAVALAFSKGEGGVLLRFELSSTTRAAGVQWLSQYPGEAEWLLPPFTVLEPAAATPGRRSSSAKTFGAKLAKAAQAAANVSGGERSTADGERSITDGERSITGDNSGMRELRFKATVRVPFQELNMRVTRLEDPPSIPDRNALLMFEAEDGEHNGDHSDRRAFESGAGAGGSFLERATGAMNLAEISSRELSQQLRDERVAAGIVGMRRGFFGGCGKGGTLLYAAVGIALAALALALLATAADIAPLSPESNGPLRTGAVGLLAAFLAFGWFARSFVLLKLNENDWDTETGGEARGTCVDLHKRQRVALWEKRAVDSLPLLWKYSGLISLGMSLDYASACVGLELAGFGVPITFEHGVPSICLSLGFGFISAMCYSIGALITYGRKRRAQDIFSGIFSLFALLFAAANLPSAFSPESGSDSGVQLQSWLRGLAGLIGAIVLARQASRRWQADREAAAGVMEDQKIYDAIVANIWRCDGAALARVKVTCSSANESAAQSLLEPGSGCGTVDDPRQGNPLKVPIMFSGVYLSHLFKLALAWSSEFRQITTGLAVKSGCRLEVPSGRQFDGIKAPARTIEKVCRVYGGRCDRVLDLLRATIVADDVGQMELALKLLTTGFDKRVCVRRIKNKFATRKVKGGFRNVHVNLLLSREGAPREAGFLCELQIQHRDIWDAEQGNDRQVLTPRGMQWVTPHERYILYRNYRAE